MKKTTTALLVSVVAAIVIAAVIVGSLAYSNHRQEVEAQERIAAAEQQRQEREAKMEATAIEECTEYVKRKAKYPAAVEFPTEPQPILEHADRGQGPSATSYYTLTFGTAHFMNGFGVPTEYDYGCVTYFDRYGTHSTPGQYGVREKNIFSGFGYSPTDDELF